MREVKLSVEKNEGGLAVLLSKVKAINENNHKEGIQYDLDLSDLNAIEDQSVIAHNFLVLVNYLKDNKLIVNSINLTNTDLGAAHTDFAKMLYGKDRYKGIGNLVGYSSGDKNKDSVIKDKLAENRREMKAAESAQAELHSSSTVDIKKVLSEENNLDVVAKNSNKNSIARPWSDIANEVDGLKDEIDDLMDDLAADFKAGKFREEPKVNNQQDVPANKNLSSNDKSKIPANEALKEAESQEQSEASSNTPRPAK